MKLNLGCGSKIIPGHVNVDKYGEPEQRWDLETFPWPWETDCVEEILLVHVLEHLGQQPDIFIRILQEMYRVCRDGALIRVTVPHPRHDHFLTDPTHVRAITPNVMAMFSKAHNRDWQARGVANTPLALLHDVDFEIVSQSSKLDEPYHSLYHAGKISLDRIREMERTLNNIVVEIEFTLKVIK